MIDRDEFEKINNQLNHVYNFINDVEGFKNNYFFNLDNTSAQTYARMISDLESKLSIEETVCKFNRAINI